MAVWEAALHRRLLACRGASPGPDREGPLQSRPERVCLVEDDLADAEVELFGDSVHVPGYAREHRRIEPLHMSLDGV